MNIKGLNKFGIKLEDYSDYAAYRHAYLNLARKVYDKSKIGRANSNARNKRYFKTDKGKLSLAKCAARYRSSIYGRKAKNALNAKRRAATLQRTPAWADLKAIKQFYLNCPKGYHVDHIVPLQGVNISGLHVLNNLQYLTKSENSSKGNRYAL